ncbi:unnamed protein product [Nezara viridula]|uniref:RAB6-interacting golgin n=1 Tax=Nezara viridula TaxID=85310 RepID=A0A9P0E772_NEZVI|nr:unnamed protein product [Nezara viridula]
MQRSFMLKKREESGYVQKKFSEVEDMEKFESVLTEDIKKIRAQIDDISKDYLELQKRFDKAEKEYLEAKVELFTKGEEKDRLVETLRGIIENCESEKAKKLSQLLSKFEIKSKFMIENKAENK